MHTIDNDRDLCEDDTPGIAIGMELLQGKWTIQILCAVQGQRVCLSELKRLNPKASKKALTASLRRLEDQGLIVRHNLSGATLHVEYELSTTVREPLIALLNGLKNRSHVVRFNKIHEGEKP